MTATLVLGGPRSGGDRQALSVLLAVRRSAVKASTDAQRQVFSLVIAAPEQIRARFRGQKLPAMLKTAAALRVHPSWDLETTTTVTVLRSLARRACSPVPTSQLSTQVLNFVSGTPFSCGVCPEISIARCGLHTG